MSLALARTLRLFDAAFRPRRAADFAAPDRVLVAAQMGIGNLVMFSPLLRAMRTAWPSAHIALAFWKRNGADQVVRDTDLADELIFLDTDGDELRQRVIKGWRLGRQDWDLLVTRFNGMPEEILSAMVLGRIPVRVGHASGADWQSGNDHLLTHPVPMPAGAHEVERYVALGRAMGLRFDSVQPEFPVRPGEFTSAGEKLREMGIDIDRPFIAMQPGTSLVQAWKRWPPELWRQMVELLEGDGIPLVAFGSPDERELLVEICAGTGAVNAAGSMSLGETAAALDRAAVLVCTDSGLMHIAAARGTPVVALFGPTDESRTGPWGDGHVLLRTDCQRPCLDLTGLREGCRAPECMGTIGPAEVAAAVRGVVGQ